MGLWSCKSKQFPKIILANRKLRVVFKNGLYGEVDCLTKRGICEKAFNVKRDQKLVLRLNISEFIHKRKRVLCGMFVKDIRTQNGSQILRQIVVIGTNGGDSWSKMRRGTSVTFLTQFGKSIEPCRLRTRRINFLTSTEFHLIGPLTLAFLKNVGASLREST